MSVVIGDMADVAVPGSYRLIFLVFNTLFNLQTQDEQVRCFENVAAHLTDDGVFVIEAFVPDSHLHFASGGIRMYPVVLRYAWPSELDLMARAAGLRLIHRWAGWNREPFTATSTSHVSVYGR